jgi:fructose-bisphosphate aldolase, class II
VRTLRDVLEDAEKTGVAVPHFNISETAGLKAVVEAVRGLKLPALVGVSEGERAFIGVRQVAALVKSYREEFGIELFLNADHTHSLAAAQEAAKAGFDEVLFDASALPFAQNITETKNAVEILKSISPSVLVEAEIGFIGNSSEIHDKAPEGLGVLTNPADAKEFVNATHIDVLAPAVGNMHGMLKSMVAGTAKKHVDSKRIAEIKQATGIFLTLHGGSGTDDEDFKSAIRAGITIIHINTELRLAWRRGLEAALRAQPDEVAPYKILPGAVDAVKQVVVDRMKLFNSKQASAAGR